MEVITTVEIKNNSNINKDVISDKNIIDDVNINVSKLNINDTTNDTTNDTNSSIYRFKFTTDVMIYLTSFAKKHQFVDRKTYKESWETWLNDNFDYSKFDNDNIVVRYINPYNPIVSTVLYKIPCDIIKELYYFLINSEDELINCIGYEMIFTSFIKTYNDCKIIKDKIGVNGYISIDGCYIDI